MIDKQQFSDFIERVTNKPRSIGLPHDSLRPGQIDALSKMRPVLNGHIPYSFWEKPTGTGKSALSAALAYLAPVTVLVHRRNLAMQYAREYGFSALMGKDEYPCIHPDKQRAWATLGDDKPTAADCHYSKMSKCPVAHACPYLIAKQAAYTARKVVFTSRMALLNRTLRQREGLWVIDECHSLVEESLGYTEKTVDLDELRRHRLHFADILINGRVGLLEPTERQYLTSWLLGCVSAIVITQSDSKENARAKKFRLKLEQLALELTVGAWFITYDGHKLTLKGLDARSVLSRIWANKQPVILISATIGNPASLASMAGIDDYTHEVYPHPVSVEARPIFDLGLPGMSYKAISDNPNLLGEQAQAIVSYIQSRPATWRGLVLTTSNKRIDVLRSALGSALGDRLFIAPGKSVNERTSQYIDNPTPGIVSVETLAGWGTGLDLRGDLARYIVVAGVQYMNRGDPFSVARLELMSEQGTSNYEGWLAHLGSVQAVGRVSRGERDASGAWLYNEAALADGLATSWRAKREYPSSMLEAIRPL